MLFCHAVRAYPLALLLLAAMAPGSVLASEREVLPATVTPEHYRIELTPDASSLTFQASVSIDIRVHRATHQIVLNSADIVIDSATLASQSAAPRIGYDAKLQTVSFRWDHELAVGAHTLRLSYHGRIYQQASGLFALDYATPHGNARALFTQFENADARRFVPCWDEPDRKATFELTATVPADQMALSNMPIASTDTLPGDLKRVHFATTPKMSSYLLFFGLGDFERVQRDVDGVDLGIVVKRGDTASAAYALEAASRILPYYNQYFGTPYPLPKLDLIAAPGASQVFSAMENWGAIFYFERAVLIDSRIATESDRQYVYTVVAHEMAHQWFGDLVTMAWWDDLWLNEGFASWMEVKVTDHFHPEWNMWLQQLGDEQYAMQEDARDGTHPIITPINDVLQASGAFDSITYLKGAAVIRTLESYLGEDAFRAGVRRYMRRYAYANSVTDDLWRQMDRGSARPITQIAHDLTLQAGVPMVSEASLKCQDDSSTLSLSQGHFAIDADSTQARVWHVPVIAAILGGSSAATIISGAAPVPLELRGCGTLILNSGQTAYFRSRYSPAELANIAAHYSALSPDDQLGVLNDTSSLAYMGLEPMASLLDVIQNFPTDADPVVATALVALLRGLDRLYDGLPAQPAFRTYAGGVLNRIFARIGWDKKPGEPDNNALLRADLIEALGSLGDASVLAEARRRFDQYLLDASSLDPATRLTVLRVIAVRANESTWEQLHAMAKSARTEIERQQLYGLLGASENAALAQRSLELALSGEPPPTVAPDIISAASERHPHEALDFAIAHWDRISPMIEPATQARFVPGLLGNAFDPSLIDELNAFAQEHIPPEARQDLRKSEAYVRYLAQVRRDRLPQINQWLQQPRG
jgi:aminopeptidase N